MARPGWTARTSIALSLLAGTALLLSQLASSVPPEAAQPAPIPQDRKTVASPPAADTTRAAQGVDLAADLTLPPPPAPADAAETAATAEPAGNGSGDAPPAAAARPAETAPPPTPKVKPRAIAALQPKVPRPEPAVERPKLVRALAPAADRPPEPTPETAPEPAAEAAPKPEPDPMRPAGAPPAEPIAGPTPPSPSETTATEPVVAVRAEASGGARDGGVLLRLREHGSGPAVEIAWPRGDALRHRLFDHMGRCLALRSAVMDPAGRLYVADPRGGTPGPEGSWRPDRDRYSGLVRQPRGYLAPAERSLRGRLASRHGLPARARVVRLFPRVVDAALLRGLSRLLGPAYREAGRITGSYRLTAGRLAVTDLRVDGRPVPGAITLAGRC